MSGFTALTHHSNLNVNITSAGYLWPVMSESCKEHRPLLCDDFLDEESFVVSQRRHMGCRGRARNKIKGAAAIIKNWPDHWSASLSYWWIGVGMVCFTIFIIYNSLLYASLPSAYSKFVKEKPTPDIMYPTTLPEVFMHVVVNNEKHVNLYKYLPYIDIVANKFVHYKFNLIVLINDTSNETQKISHQFKLNNDEALNTLWSINDINDFNTTPKQKFSNIAMKQNKLSNYLDNSPVRNYWRNLPHQFIELLLRVVSIWEKGGIALNPIILTPRSPHSIYIEKLNSLLRMYQKVPKLSITENVNRTAQIIKHNKNEFKHFTRKRVNNIRDIIDNLNNEQNSKDDVESLSEAENRQIVTKVDMKPYLNNFIVITKEGSLNITGNPTINEMLGNKTDASSVRVDTEKRLEQSKLTKNIEFLPSFLNFLFRDKSKIAINAATTRNTTKRSLKTNSVNFSNEIEKNSIMQPMIIPAPTFFDSVIKTDIQDNISEIDETDDLTIDLEGNLLSTKTPCHAFIGSVLNNVKHCGKDESIKDFIISELSQFCKGVLSTCKGVNVILI